MPPSQCGATTRQHAIRGAIRDRPRELRAGAPHPPSEIGVDTKRLRYERVVHVIGPDYGLTFCGAVTALEPVGRHDRRALRLPLEQVLVAGDDVVVDALIGPDANSGRDVSQFARHWRNDDVVEVWDDLVARNDEY